MDDGDDEQDRDAYSSDGAPALERDPRFLRRLPQHDRARLQQRLGEELRHHWRRVPFTGDLLGQLAPQLTWVLGDGNANRAFEVLEGILYEFLDDDRIGGLAAAWGLHPKVDPHQSVDQRFSDFASLIGREGSFAGRRRAEKGSEFLAEFLASMDVGTDGRGSLHVRVTGQPDAVEARFLMMNGRTDASWFLSTQSKHLPELEVVATADELSPSVPDWVARWELPVNGPWWKAFVLRGDVSDLPYSVGSIEIEMTWVAIERPTVVLQHDLSWVESHTAISRSRGCILALSWENQ